MTVSAQFRAFVEELLSPHGAVRIRAMFGGAGVYLDDLMVALIADDMLYLKADAQTEERFADAGCEQFSYDAKGRAMTMSYWSCPEAAFDDRQAMAAWLEAARAAAVRAAAKRKPKRADR